MALAGFFILCATSAQAAQITLAWDPIETPVAAGYRVYQGTSSRNYTTSIDVGQQTRHTLTGLNPGQTYYFAVTAYRSGQESGFSNEVSATLPGGPPQGSPNPDGGGNAAPGLVAAYGFEENEGTTVIDATGQANGVIRGAARVDGRFGRALSFNGQGDWVTVDASPKLALSGAFTLEAWVFPTENTGWRAVIFNEDATYYLYASSAYGNSPLVGSNIGTGVELHGGGPLPLQTWVHLAGTWDGSVQRLYIDGVLVQERAQGGVLPSIAKPLRLGGNGLWGDFFAGIIDEVRVYNRALTADEIQADMNTPVEGG